MTRQSIFWSAVRNWGPRIGTILTFFALARILTREQLGLFAAAAALISFAELFAENGFGDAVVRAPRVTPALAMFVVIANSSLAAVVYGLLYLFSPKLEQFSGIGGLGTIVPIVSLSILFNSFGYVPQALLRKEHKFKRLAVRAIIATLLGAATGLSMALMGFGVFSMAGQLLVTALVNVISLWVPLSVKLAWPKTEGFGDISKFAVRVGGARFLNFLSNRSLELLIPIFFGPTSLAIYIMGSRIPAVLAQMITSVMVDVHLPHLAGYADNPDALRREHFKNLRRFASLSLPCFLAVAALSPQIASLAFGSNGTGTAPIIFMCAVLGAFQSLGYCNEVFLSASNAPGVNLKFYVLLTCLVLVSAFSLKATSLEVLVAAYVTIQTAIIASAIMYSAIGKGLSLASFRAAVGPSAVSSIGAMLITIAASYPICTLFMNELQQSLILGAAYAASYCIAMRILDGPLTTEVLSQIRLAIR